MKKKLGLLIILCMLLIPCALFFSACGITKETYTVSFYNEDGTAIETINIKEGKSSIGPDAEKASDRYNVYVFDKWLFEDGTDATQSLKSVKSNLTVYASFKATQPVYSINFYDNDGTTLLHTNKVVRGYATPINPTVSAKQDEYFNLEFEHWEDVDGEEWVGEEIVSGDINIYASYNIVSQHTACPIEFYDEDGVTLLYTQSLMNGVDINGNIYAGSQVCEYNGYYYTNKVKCWVDDDGKEVTKLDILELKNHKVYAVYYEINQINAIVDGVECYCFTQSNDGTYYALTSTSSLISVAFPDNFNLIPVTHILNSVNFSSTSYITIPDSITYIEEGTFSGGGINTVEYLGDINGWVSITFADTSASPLCSPVAQLRINGKVVTSATITATTIKPNAFYGYEKLTSVTIGESVTAIGDSVFGNCAELEEVTIGSRVESIGANCFTDSRALKAINYLGDINGWVSITFADTSASPLFYGADLKINGEVVTSATITATEIKPYVFYFYKKLVSVTIGEGVAIIGRQSFEFCSALTNVTIGSSIESMNFRAFDGCTALEEINYLGDINDWVSISFSTNEANPLYYGVNLKINGEVVTSANITATEIKPYAFIGYKALTSVTIGDGVTNIGTAAFKDCTALEEVNYLGDVNGWVSIMFASGNANPLYCGASLKINSEVVTSANITATEINSYAFNGYNLLTSVIIGENIESIGLDSFNACTELTTITIDSPTIANGLVGEYDNGCLVQKAETIYIKSDLTISNATYLLENFTKQATSDKTGYDMYVRNAE